MVRGSPPAAVPPDSVSDSGTGLGEYLGAEETRHEESPGCGLTMLLAWPVVGVGVGLVAPRASVTFTIVGVVSALIRPASRYMCCVYLAGLS